jgi:hypothetical protein
MLDPTGSPGNNSRSDTTSQSVVWTIGSRQGGCRFFGLGELFASILGSATRPCVPIVSPIEPDRNVA